MGIIYAECRKQVFCVVCNYADYLSVIMPIVGMLSAIMPNIVMLNASMLNFDMLSIMVPSLGMHTNSGNITMGCYKGLIDSVHNLIPLLQCVDCVL